LDIIWENILYRGELIMDKQESKILQEILELKNKFNQIKTILTDDITTIAKQIDDKIDLKTYKYTDEEFAIIDEIESIAKEIVEALDLFYKYSDEE
jgi:hypothetical protein